MVLMKMSAHHHCKFVGKKLPCIFKKSGGQVKDSFRVKGEKKGDSHCVQRSLGTPLVPRWKPRGRLKGKVGVHP